MKTNIKIYSILIFSLLLQFNRLQAQSDCCCDGNSNGVQGPCLGGRMDTNEVICETLPDGAIQITLLDGQAPYLIETASGLSTSISENFINLQGFPQNDTLFITNNIKCKFIKQLDEQSGCTDPCAPNYNPNATLDNGSCEPPLFGCTDPAANNYDPNALCDDGSCNFNIPDCCWKCLDNSLVDFKNNINQSDCTFMGYNWHPGPCNPPETYNCGILGCTNPAACNFNPNATEDDGSCILPPECNDDPCFGDIEVLGPTNCTCVVIEPQVLGCMDFAANNYNPDANCNDGSCFSCSDGIQNGNETGIDCGGPDCEPCECQNQYSYSVSPICSGETPYIDVNQSCIEVINSIDLDVYVYTENDLFTKAPAGFNPLEQVNGQSSVFPLESDLLQYLETGVGNWYESPICSSFEIIDFAFENYSNQKDTISLFLIPWHYTNELDGYNNIDSVACEIVELDLIIHPESNCLGNCTDVIHLKAGWNLISLDVSPYQPSVDSIFADLSPGNLVYVTAFDNGALIYDADPMIPPFLNTLNSFEDGYGYWVKLNDTDTLEITGVCIPDTLKRDFDAGWNLIAYPPDTSSIPTNYFADEIVNNNLIITTGYDMGTMIFDPAIPQFLNTLNSLKNGFGYWAKFNNGAINKTGDTYFNTNIFSFISGKTNLPEGSIINFQTANGDKVGEMKVVQEGYLFVTPLYGDDLLTTNKIEGLTIGETLYFSYNNQVSKVDAVFKGDMSLEKVELLFDQTPSITINPNPNYGSFQIALEKPILYGLVEVIDALGKVHFQNTIEQASSIFNIDLPSTKSGIYLVKITDEDSTSIQKVVIH